jgi:hypothetical protein
VVDESTVGAAFCEWKHIALLMVASHLFWREFSQEWAKEVREKKEVIHRDILF